MARRKTGGGGRTKANVGRRYRLEPTPAQHEVLRGFGHTRRYLSNACIAAWLLAIDLRVRPDASRAVIDELREGLEHQDSWKGGTAWEVAREELLTAAQTPAARSSAPRLHRDDFAHEEKRVTVRQQVGRAHRHDATSITARCTVSGRW